MGIGKNLMENKIIKHLEKAIGKHAVLHTPEDLAVYSYDGTFEEHSPDLVCLSSLMTTTIQEMPRVIKALKDNGLKIPVMVGGAVVTEDFAEEIGAEYGKDALDAVEEVSKIFGMWKK